jgi:hypothetical protein
MNNTKYIGVGVHKESISIAVIISADKIVLECVVETKASIILPFVDGLRGDLHVTLEEGTSGADAPTGRVLLLTAGRVEIAAPASAA